MESVDAAESIFSHPFNRKPTRTVFQMIYLAVLAGDVAVSVHAEFFLYDNGGLWLLSVVKRGRRGHREAGTFMAAVDTSNDSPGAVMLCVGIV